MKLMPEQRLDVTAAAKHAKNEHVLFLKAVDDEVLTHGEASQAGAQVPPRGHVLYWDGWQEERSGP